MLIPQAVVQSPSGQLLALHVYSPAAQAVYSTSSSTLSDVDATNAAITFTAPASGNVIVRVNCWGDSTGSDDGFIGLREGSNNIGGTITRAVRANASQQYLSVPMYVTGLSAGSTHTMKLSFANIANVIAIRLIVQDGNAGNWGPLIMEVWSAP